MTRKISSKQKKTEDLREIAGSDVVVLFPRDRQISGCLTFLPGEAQKCGWYVAPKHGEPVRLFKREITEIVVDEETEIPVLFVMPSTNAPKHTNYGLAPEHREIFYNQQISA